MTSSRRDRLSVRVDVMLMFEMTDRLSARVDVMLMFELTSCLLRLTFFDERCSYLAQ